MAIEVVRVLGPEYQTTVSFHKNKHDEKRGNRGRKHLSVTRLSENVMDPPAAFMKKHEAVMDVLAQRCAALAGGGLTAKEAEKGLQA